MDAVNLATQSQEFLNYLDDWLEALPNLAGAEVFSQPDRCAIISVDVVNGFCAFGVLSSPRVGAIAAPIAAFFERAWESGVRKIILTQDTHEPDAVEFANFPPHCVRGTPEAEPVDQFKALPFLIAWSRCPKIRSILG